MSVNSTPMSSSSFLILWYTTSDSYCAETPPRYFFSASGIPSLSQVPRMSSGRSDHSWACFSVERMK